MDFRGRSFPVPADIDREGWALVLCMAHPDEVEAPDALIFLADGLEQNVAEFFATMLDRSPGILLDMADLADPAGAGAGKVWMFMATQVESRFVAEAFERGVVFAFGDGIPVQPDGFRALMTAYELGSGDQSAPDFPLPDFDYGVLRRKVLGLRVVDPVDREGLAGYAAFVSDSRSRFLDDAERIDELAADIADALADKVEISTGLYSVVIDTNLSFRVGGEVRKGAGGYRSIVVAHGLTVRQAAFLHAIVLAAPADFLLDTRMVPKIVGDEEILDVRIVREDQLGWVGVDLTGVRDAERYARLVEITRAMAAYGLQYTVQQIAQRMVEMEADVASAALMAGDRSR